MVAFSVALHLDFDQNLQRKQIQLYQEIDIGYRPAGCNDTLQGSYSMKLQESPNSSLTVHHSKKDVQPTNKTNSGNWLCRLARSMNSSLALHIQNGRQLYFGNYLHKVHLASYFIQYTLKNALQ